MIDAPERDIVLQFSGGKDSLACLYLCRDMLDRVAVVHGDTGANFPHVREFVEKTCTDLGAHLVIVSPQEPIRDYIARMGIPADMVPVHNAVDYASLTGGRMEPLNPWVRCCLDNSWAPMQNWIAAQRPKYLIRGAKRNDLRVGAVDGIILGGVQLIQPFWEYTDDQVLDFLRQAGASLPSHYEHVKTSLDCSLCSANLTFDPGRERIAYTKKYHPELWPELKHNLEILQRVVTAEAEIIHEALGDLELQPGGRMRMP